MNFNPIRSHQPPGAFLPKKSIKSQATSVRFGRDAIYERNNALQDRLERNADEAPTDVFIATHGRVCRHSELPNVLEQAKTRYEALKTNPNANPIEKGLAGVKLANAQLAEDADIEAAFELLKQSIDLLDEAGYLPLSWLAPPEYIHGLYNRGSYAFNNILHQYNLAVLDSEGIADSINEFEGLTVAAPENPEEERELIGQLLEGLPFLDRAIMLSQGIPDQKIAQVEYQSAKGEVMHALSHLENTDDIYSGQALSSFVNAWKELRTIGPENQTPQHIELENKLSRVKIRHLCSENHITDDTGPLCQMFEQRTARRASTSAAAAAQPGNVFNRSKRTKH